MHDIASLELGAQLSNDELCAIFLCGPQGGMRRSKRTNTLVLICNHLDSIYEDRWIDGVLHYTGMGQKGDQSLNFMQNRTLAESSRNGVAVHLFEVFTPKPRIYTYAGEVVLADEPYQEVQPDEDKNDRKVWVFPLTPKSDRIPALPANLFEEVEERRARRIKRLTDKEIEARARQGGKSVVGSRPATIRTHQRNEYVVEHAKRRAKGHCELCRKPAPFTDNDDRPYLETHHIVWLARGGPDTVENTVALCPNCHRRMHVQDRAVDKQTLVAMTQNKESRTVAHDDCDS
ncbi:HNH endonuclease [Sphingomicrobium lutaoense]|uniref:5-methylcytosine-specific restriction protein A n=1 Tax=Sphingomicrobium lutaoense TaxID=515949 RepID=A0A839YW63_9SPHN|nr:HNH endonuclease [Sphingomicrobium lutaoense]MBB3763439.1 5-methylcytosine-specific restriction protein A [Sphingomicrobium lutaoense]